MEPSKTDTIGTNNFVRCSEVSLAQGLVVDHAHPTIVASYRMAGNFCGVLIFIIIVVDLAVMKFSTHEN